MTLQTSEQPLFVARYRANGHDHWMEMGEAEIARAQTFFTRVVRLENFPVDSKALIISSYADAAFMNPFERALIDLGMVITASENSPFDGARTEATLRRFDVRLIAPVSAMALDAVIAAGHDPLQIFKGRVVWAWPDAYERLKGADGIDLRRWFEIGPVILFENARGVLAYDSREWSIDFKGAQATVSSRLTRRHVFDALQVTLPCGMEHGPVEDGFAGGRAVIMGN